MPRERKRPRRDIVAWSLIVALFAAPIASLTVSGYLLANAEETGAASAVPVFATVERADFLDSQPVTVGLTWAEGVKLRAPAWSGLVVEIGVVPGDVVRAGSRLVRVDGTWRVAAPMPAPLYEGVSARSSKGEVRAVNALLRAMGYDVPGDAWTFQTLASVRRFASDIGVPEASVIEMLDPSWLIWMPVDEMMVASVPTDLGVPAPSAGEVVLGGPPRLARLVVTVEEGSLLPLVEEENAWVLRVGDASVPYTAPEMSDGVGDSTIASKLASTQPEETTGVIQRAEPVSGWQLPVSAVHTDASGNRCVFRRGDSDSGYIAVQVDVQGGSIGTARVAGQLKITDAVLVNPSDILRDASCE